MITIGLVKTNRLIPVPAGEWDRFLPWLTAFIAYIAGLAALGAVSLGDAMRTAEQVVGGRLTLVIPAEASDARVQTALAALKQTPGIATARLFTPAETGKLLDPWLGTSVPLQELPVPHLIDAEPAPGKSLDIAALRQHLASIVPDVQIDDHRTWLDDLRSAYRRIYGVLSCVLAVSVGLLAVSGLFAARAALQAGRSGVELVHLLGAADAAIAGPFVARSLKTSLLGAGIAGVALVITMIALHGVAAAFRSPFPLVVAGLGDWRLWAVVGGMIVLTVVLALACARLTVLHLLRQMP